MSVKAKKTPVRRKPGGKPGKGRTKAEQRAETQERILDAAEVLFSKHGLHGVALKDVAQAVGVHAALMHYYFDDKKALFDAVMERRAPITAGRRIAAMDAYEASVGGNVTVEGALHAFLDTDLDTYISGGEPWRNYGTLAAVVAYTPDWGTAILSRLMDPVVLRLISLLKKAMPGVPDEKIYWGYHFVSGGLMMTLARTGRIDKLSGGICQSEDFETVKLHMARFMAGGFKAIAEQPDQTQRKKRRPPNAASS